MATRTPFHLVVLILATLWLLSPRCAVARPYQGTRDVILAPQKGGLKTNAERFAHGLPPLPPSEPFGLFVQRWLISGIQKEDRPLWVPLCDLGSRDQFHLTSECHPLLYRHTDGTPMTNPFSDNIRVATEADPYGGEFVNLRSVFPGSYYMCVQEQGAGRDFADGGYCSIYGSTTPTDGLEPAPILGSSFSFGSALWSASATGDLTPHYPDENGLTISLDVYVPTNPGDPNTIVSSTIFTRNPDVGPSRAPQWVWFQAIMYMDLNA
ncbi:hypothetical protein FRB99_007685 [Tulasnella sp. 403]|nr:hypothetical protein FRB99_007685 [Tulasnella sp. 403]